MRHRPYATTARQGYGAVSGPGLSGHGVSGRRDRHAAHQEPIRKRVPARRARRASVGPALTLPVYVQGSALGHGMVRSRCGEVARRPRQPLYTSSDGLITPAATASLHQQRRPLYTSTSSHNSPQGDEAQACAAARFVVACLWLCAGQAFFHASIDHVLVHTTNESRPYFMHTSIGHVPYPAVSVTSLTLLYPSPMQNSSRPLRIGARSCRASTHPPHTQRACSQKPACRAGAACACCPAPPPPHL
jgi:hypothetical protein